MRIPFTVLPSEDDAPVAEAEKVIVEEHTARSVVEDDDLEVQFAKVSDTLIMYV